MSLTTAKRDPRARIIEESNKLSESFTIVRPISCEIGKK